MPPALFAAILIPLLIATALPLLLSTNHWKAAEQKENDRQMANHRMHARLLRLDI